MALRVAGMHLRRDFSARHTFDQYRHDLDPRYLTLPSMPLDRAVIPQARPLLWLLACYAPSSLILEEILASARRRRRSLRARIRWPASSTRASQLPAGQLAEYCRTGLQELQSAGLIDRSDS